MRFVSWNIRAGGGVRANEIARAIIKWQPDVVALSEFRGTAPSQNIAELLNLSGLCYQRNTVDRMQPAVNSLLVASRWPLRAIKLKRAPDNPRRWLHVNVAAPMPFAVMAMHIPNRVTGMKYPFMDAVLDVLRTWGGPPALLAGDTNSGRIGIDEESSAFNKREDDWISSIVELGWLDAFRLVNGDSREFTWYSPNGRNGFRLDQIFLHQSFFRKQVGFSHCWANEVFVRREVLSDHAALIVDCEL